MFIGLYLLNAAINAIPARVTRVQALLPFTELGAMQALLQSGMSFSGVDSRNAVFGLKAPKDALDRRRLELHKARLDLSEFAHSEMSVATRFLDYVQYLC